MSQLAQPHIYLLGETVNQPFKSWTINLDDKTATDIDGLVIKFTEPTEGTLEGEIQNPDELEKESDAIPLIQDAARALLAEMKKQRDQAG